MQLSVIIPAFNEESTIKSTLIAIAGYLRSAVPDSEIIVVDDGSSDNTQTIATTLSFDIPLRVIVHPNNKGKGAAVRTGIREAKGNYILFIDADLSTDIAQYTYLENALRAGADIAIGSRYLSDSFVAVHQPWFRVMMGRIANGAIRFTLLPGIYDTQCGFKLFRREAALLLVGLQKMDTWSFDMELLILARRLGFCIKEVPVVWENSNRTSRFRSIRDTGRTAGDIVRIVYHLMAGHYGDHPRAPRYPKGISG